MAPLLGNDLLAGDGDSGSMVMVVNRVSEILLVSNNANTGFEERNCGLCVTEIGEWRRACAA